MSAPINAVGMAWYKPEHFGRLRAMFKDGHKLHRTHDEWLRAAETGRKSYEVKGIRVVCVDIDPDEFPRWCKAEGLQLDADARMRYANLIAYKVLTGAQSPGAVQ